MQKTKKIFTHCSFYVFTLFACLQFTTAEAKAKPAEQTSIDIPVTYEAKQSQYAPTAKYTICNPYGDNIEDEDDWLYEDDEPDGEGSCGEAITWKLNDKTLTITGTGKMYDYPATPPWYKDAYKIEKVELSEGITYIGVAAFYECDELTDIKIPSTVTEIGEGAFVRCYSLEQITLPEQLKKIDAYAFQDTRIKEITLPAGLNFIGESAFSCCVELRTIQIPSGITNIKKAAFEECSELASISLPKDLKTIEDAAFYNCSSLKKITLPKRVKKIGNYAFYGCKALKSVKLPSSLRDIGIYTFSRGTKAKNLPDDVSQMEDGALCKAARVKIKVKECYKEAFAVLKLVNKERKKKGLNTLKMDKELLEAAMFRGAENCLYYSHGRPSGFSWNTISELVWGENIAVGQHDAAMVMDDWMHSPGHKANILNKRWNTIGIGCVEMNGIKYWVQCFGEEKSSVAKEKSYKDKSKNRTIKVAPEYLAKVSNISITSSTVGAGGTIDVNVAWYNQFLVISIPAENMEYKSTKKSVCKAVKGKIKGVKPGTAKIKIWFPGYKKGAVTKKITVL
ncbi:MAG: leucine-rich repeat protein [Lachnospiraceae bacterium]|nr:leucine-rich repeat protein [Lachnospiraceae bacterium]